MARTHRKFTPEEKVAILRRHLLEHVRVSDLCDEYQLHPNVFYRWQKEFFENGAAAFQRRDDARARALQQANDTLARRLAQKDEVIAEIMESHVALKKKLGRP